MEQGISKVLPGNIDAHQHFWHYHPEQHNWISDDMSGIRKDFLPADLASVLKENGITGCIAVQADQSEKETDFLLQLANENNFVKGIVGWVDLHAPSLPSRLAHYEQYEKIKGFRHILQGEDPGFMLQPDFIKGIGQLRQFNFTYDILVFPGHLPAVLELVKQFPNQAFVVDHLAKPYIKDGQVEKWKKDLAAVAVHPNVYCKLSGMVTEADMRHWKPADFTPYLDAVVEMFGMDRVMYGSDWPVCLAAGAYASVLSIVKNYFAEFSVDEQQAFFGGNATAFYHLT